MEQYTSSKYNEGQCVEYLTSADPASLRTGFGVIERVMWDYNCGWMYFIRSRWRLENQIIQEVVQ